MKRLQALGAGLSLAGILSLAACGGDNDAGPGEQPESATPEPGGTAVVVEGADINSPLAVVAASVLDGNLASDVMNMELVRGQWRDGRLVFVTADESPMAIARRYEYVGPDSASLRFHMRSDLLWSDGEPITAEDVVFTYDLIRVPEMGSPLQAYVEHLDSVVAETDSTVVFHFARRYPEMLTHSAVALVPEHAFRGVNPADIRTHPRLLDPANGNLVVSGPWMIGTWQKGQRVELVRNPRFQPQPHLERLVFRIIPEAATRLVELQTGNVDMVYGVTFDQIPALRAQMPDVRFEREARRGYDYIAYNPQGHPAFADPEIRRALGLAIDVPRMIQALQMDEFAEPAGGPYAPVFSDLYDPRLTPPLGHDAERAREILASKGWSDGDGDGIVEKDGQPFRFTLVTNSGNQRRADAAQIAQQQWRQVGVDVQLRQLEFNTFMQSLMGKEYEASLGGWSVGLSADLSPLWAPDSPFNITGYASPEASALLERALVQPTAAAAAPLWKEFASEVVSDQPYTWLYYYDIVDAVGPRLRGMHVDTYGSYQNTWEWWIPRSLQRGAQAPTS